MDFEKAREAHTERGMVEECSNASADIIFDILERLFPSAVGFVQLRLIFMR